VSPVLVDDDPARASPEEPEMAVGVAVTVASPPDEPSELPEPTLDPPLLEVWAWAGEASSSSAPAAASAEKRVALRGL
jgi:hypothetical protein